MKRNIRRSFSKSKPKVSRFIAERAAEKEKAAGSTGLFVKHATVPAKPVQRNWFGRECHPSDSLIHWGDDHRTESFAFYWVDNGKQYKTFDEYVDALRAAWDLVHAETTLAAASKMLLDAKGHIESMEQGERDAGEDL